MSDDIIKVDAARIRNCYNSIKEGEIPEVLFKKRKELLDKYNCFQASYCPEHFEVKRYGKYVKKKEYVHHNTNSVSHTKLHIIPVDFTEENKVRRVYIGYLNKLTEKNKDTMKSKIGDVLQKGEKEGIDTTMLLYSTVWEFIKKSQQRVYDEILGMFSSSLTRDYITDYVTNKRWLPSHEILETNLTSSDISVYDLYCHYVKWKKEVSNTIVSICNLTEDRALLEVMMDDLHSLMVSFSDMYKTHKHITDFALEQIYNILKRHYKKEVADRIGMQDTSSYESYTKFLILNIVEL